VQIAEGMRGALPGLGMTSPASMHGAAPAHHRLDRCPDRNHAMSSSRHLFLWTSQPLTVQPTDRSAHEPTTLLASQKHLAPALPDSHWLTAAGGGTRVGGGGADVAWAGDGGSGGEGRGGGESTAWAGDGGSDGEGEGRGGGEGTGAGEGGAGGEGGGEDREGEGGGASQGTLAAQSQ
jgi:hypothetical protein